MSGSVVMRPHLWGTRILQVPRRLLMRIDQLRSSGSLAGQTPAVTAHRDAQPDVRNQIAFTGYQLRMELKVGKRTWVPGWPRKTRLSRGRAYGQGNICLEVLRKKNFMGS